MIRLKHCNKKHMDIEKDDYDDSLEDQMHSLLFLRQLEQGEIWINEIISKSTVSRINMNLKHLESRDDIDTIHMYLNSQGGSLFDALACVDFMRTINKPVHVYAMGVVMSGAFLIYAAGDYRIAYPFSTFMIHDQRLEYVNGLRHILRQELTFQDKVNDKILNYLTERSTTPKEQWADYCEKDSDTYFESAEAKKLGIVDEIMEHLKEKSIES